MGSEERFLRMENALSTLVELAQKSDERMTRIEEAQRRAEERWGRTEESIRNLLAIAELHDREIKETNENLNVLINTVERFIGSKE